MRIFFILLINIFVRKPSCKVEQKFQIEAVIHFAGLKAVGESVQKPLDYFAVNIEGTITLLEAMEAQHIQKLVFSSSATVYGEPQYLPLNEFHPTSVSNPYGRCKLHIEDMLLDLSYADPNWQMVCLRYFNPVGAHASGLIGEEPQSKPNNLMPYIARVAIREYPYLQVYGNDYVTIDGTGVRDYIHVMDLAEGHVKALEYLSTTDNLLVANLGTGKGSSVLQVLNAFEKLMFTMLALTTVNKSNCTVGKV